MEKTVFDWRKAPQMSIIQLLLATFIPSAIAFIGFHLILPVLVTNGWPVLIAWPLVASVMLSALVIAAIVLLYREAKSLKISFWARLCLKALSPKEWAISIAIMVVALFLSTITQTLVPPAMKALELTIPDYMPFFLNPAIDPLATDPAILSPGLQLSGAYGLLPLIGITLLLNILTEELYFRAWMLPKLSKYGNWGWVANGILFALYHTFQLWLLPTLLVMSLAVAFVFYRSKSLWPPLAIHLIGNFLLSILGVLMLVVS